MGAALGAHRTERPPSGEVCPGARAAGAGYECDAPSAWTTDDTDRLHAYRRGGKEWREEWRGPKDGLPQRLHHVHTRGPSDRQVVLSCRQDPSEIAIPSLEHDHGLLVRSLLVTGDTNHLAQRAHPVSRRSARLDSLCALPTLSRFPGTFLRMGACTVAGGAVVRNTSLLHRELGDTYLRVHSADGAVEARHRVAELVDVSAEFDGSSRDRDRRATGVSCAETSASDRLRRGGADLDGLRLHGASRHAQSMRRQE